jgi:hypothetical protein
MSFISSTNINVSSFTGAYQDFFDYFKKEIIVYKQPKKTVADVSLSFLYGYGTDSNGDNYSFTPVSGSFSGLIVYGKNRDDQDLDQANIRLPDDVVKLKVEKTARDYINNGMTECLEFDDKKFFIKSSDIKEVFLNKNYYVYVLAEAE